MKDRDLEQQPHHVLRGMIDELTADLLEARKEVEREHRRSAEDAVKALEKAKKALEGLMEILVDRPRKTRKRKKRGPYKKKVKE